MLLLLAPLDFGQLQLILDMHMLLNEITVEHGASFRHSQHRMASQATILAMLYTFQENLSLLEQKSMIQMA
jgi:hypothetical protein